MEASLRCRRGCKAVVALCFMVMFGEGLVLSGKNQGERNASNALVQLNAEAPDLGDFCDHAGTRIFNNDFIHWDRRQFVQLKGYMFSGGREERKHYWYPNANTFTEKCDDYDSFGQDGICPGFGGPNDGTDGNMHFWISTRGVHTDYQWPQIVPRHDWTICVVKNLYDDFIGFPVDAHACSYFTTSDACPCVWTGSECQAGDSMWFVVWHVQDHAEGEVYSNEEAARAKFNDLDGGALAAVLYDQDLTEYVRYGGMGQDSWQQLLDWAASERKQRKS